MPLAVGSLNSDELGSSSVREDKQLKKVRLTCDPARRGHNPHHPDRWPSAGISPTNVLKGEGYRNTPPFPITKRWLVHRIVTLSRSKAVDLIIKRSGLTLSIPFHAVGEMVSRKKASPTISYAS
jgi:hypothetical protein